MIKRISSLRHKPGAILRCATSHAFIKSRTVTIILTLVVAVTFCVAQNRQNQVRRLTQGEFVARELRGGETHRYGEALTFSNLMLQSRDLNKAQIGIVYGKQAINLFQELRSNIQEMDKEIQKTYLATKRAKLETA